MDVGVASLRQFTLRPFVTYPRNPLFEVIFAIRFPPVLALSSEPPVEFQKGFAKEYPFVEVTKAVGSFSFSGDVGEKIQPAATPSTYFFSDPTRHWKIGLEQNLLSLTCLKYSSWVDFRARLEPILNAVKQIYGIEYIGRLGLRFRDVVDKNDLGLANSSWSELIDPRVLGTFLFFSDDVDSDSGMSATIELAIPPGLVKIQLAKVANSRSKHTGLLIDTDCFDPAERPMVPGELLARADELHRYTNVIFQACITDKLHNALLSD
jgi:uncharacterized protein (TIGR04255 family)